MKRVRVIQRGGSVLKMILIIPAAMLVAGIGWLVYADQRLKYWDDKVREMCAKEGGVQVLQHVPLTPAEFEAMPRSGGHVSGAAPLELTRPEVPTYAESRMEVIREASPRIWKTVVLVVRKSDGATVARWVRVSRSGGDPIAIDHPSHFICPPVEQMSAELAKVYVKKEIK
jgi:hypothetical protein